MITVKEVFGKDALSACEKFALTKEETDRVFAIYDGELSGAGLTAIRNGAIVITACEAQGEESYRELLLRSLLLDATRLTGFKTVIALQGDYSRFGFVAEDGVWISQSDKIIFPHDCKGETRLC